MHQVLEPLVLVLQGVIRLIIPSADSEQPRGDDRLFGFVGKLVPRQLLDNKPVVRFVAIDGLDDIIPILPRSGLWRIPLVTVGVGIADQVQPVAAPPLAKMGRGKEAVHLALVSIGRRVALERLDFVEGRW